MGEAKIDKLTALIEAKEIEKGETIQAITDLEADIVSMKDQRAAENQAFLEAKGEDEDAIKLLTEARDALSAYFTKNKIEMGKVQGFLQQGPEFDVPEDQAPDATFSDK